LNRYTLIALLVGLAVGGLLGYQAGSAGRVTREPVAAAPAAPPMGGGFGAPAPAPSGQPAVQQRIAAAEQIVARDPKNVGAWVQLGNDYFDTNQPKKSVEAYGRALELQPDNADVLTDQGVMYRELGDFDHAIANFTKANQVNPQHVQSLFNLGVVYLHDKKDAGKAREAWNRIVQTAPNSPQAQQARAALAQIPQTPAK
jgi:cytochrome c-type biogenesis protein CcmH/NrfG